MRHKDSVDHMQIIRAGQVKTFRTVSLVWKPLISPESPGMSCATISMLIPDDDIQSEGKDQD